MKNKILSVVAVVGLSACLAQTGQAFAQDSVGGSWEYSSNRWWYKHVDSSYTTNGWEYIDGKWYHFDNEGWMQTGWIKASDKWYYLDDSGAMKTGWINLSGTWYYLDDSGAMKTGWLKYSDKWYYLSGSGAMQVGWQNIDGDTYFFADSGESTSIHRRALVLGETSTPAVPLADVNAMGHVFENHNFNQVTRFANRTKAEIIAKMEELFKNSQNSDVNYLYFTCHGGQDGRIYIGSDKTSFTGWELANILKQYKGKFVVMLDCCFAGKIISKGDETNSDTSSLEGFNADAFISGFSNISGNEKSGELLDSKFLVLCSSRGDEYSTGGTVSLATQYWSRGAGWEPFGDFNISPAADTDRNNKVSLEELYNYSQEKVVSRKSSQHVVVYPSQSPFVLFK